MAPHGLFRRNAGALGLSGGGAGAAAAPRSGHRRARGERGHRPRSGATTTGGRHCRRHAAGSAGAHQSGAGLGGAGLHGERARRSVLLPVRRHPGAQGGRFGLDSSDRRRGPVFAGLAVAGLAGAHRARRTRRRRGAAGEMVATGVHAGAGGFRRAGDEARGYFAHRRHAHHSGGGGAATGAHAAADGAGGGRNRCSRRPAGAAGLTAFRPALGPGHGGRGGAAVSAAAGVAAARLRGCEQIRHARSSRPNRPTRRCKCAPCRRARLCFAP